MEKKSRIFEKITIKIQSWYISRFRIKINKPSRQTLPDFNDKLSNFWPPFSIKRWVFEILYKKLGISDGFAKGQGKIRNDASLEPLELQKWLENL